jgi:MoaA/NifB/PqqE/SkfB family radical SAM enzyme
MLKHIYNLKKAQLNKDSRNCYLDSYPVNIHFLLADKCNSRCIMCAGNYYNSRSGKRITAEQFKTMASNLKLEYASGINLSGGGDPLLNEDMESIIRFVRKEYPNIQISVTTNGIALDGKAAEVMLASDVLSINVSLNAATKETYQRIMQVDCFERVCRNVAAFTCARKAMKKNTRVQLSVILSRLNIEEMPAFIILGKQLGADSVNAMYCRFYPEALRHMNVEQEEARLLDEESLFFHQELSDKTMDEAERVARDAGMAFTHEPLFRENAEPRECYWPTMKIMIGTEGEVYPCGGGEVHFKDKVNKGIYDFGNALTSTIDEFWNNEHYLSLRRSSKDGGLSGIPECRCCVNKMTPARRESHILKWQS